MKNGATSFRRWRRDGRHHSRRPLNNSAPLITLFTRLVDRTLRVVIHLPRPVLWRRSQILRFAVAQQQKENNPTLPSRAPFHNWSVGPPTLFFLFLLRVFLLLSTNGVSFMVDPSVASGFCFWNNHSTHVIVCVCVCLCVEQQCSGRPADDQPGTGTRTPAASAERVAAGRGPQPLFASR